MGAAPPALNILYIFCTRILCRCCCSSFIHLRRMMGRRSRRKSSIRGILLFNTYQIPSIRRKTRNNSIIPVTVPTLRVQRKRAQVVVCGGRRLVDGGGQLQLQSLWLFTKESSNGMHCQGSRRNSKKRERDAASDDGWCEWKEQSGYL